MSNLVHFQDKMVNYFSSKMNLAEAKVLIIKLKFILISGELPPTVEKIDGNTKTVTEYSYNNDDKKVKVSLFFL